jgi:hypothetical protein
MERAELTTKGLPRRTGESIAVDFDDMHEVVRWKGRVMGIAMHTFSHPKEWRLTGADAPLEKMDVKALTRVIGAAHRTEPSCLRAWEQRHQRPTQAPVLRFARVGTTEQVVTQLCRASHSGGGATCLSPTSTEHVGGVG